MTFFKAELRGKSLYTPFTIFASSIGLAEISCLPTADSSPKIFHVSNYEFSLRQEVLLEKGADILGSLFHFARNNHISPSDKKDPVNVVYGLVWNAKSSILGADTEAELDQIETQFDFARKFYAGIEA